MAICPSPRTREAEVLPVPSHKIASVWKPVSRWLSKIPNYDLEATRMRLLLGEAQLWVAVITKGSFWETPYTAVIITSVHDQPPFKPIRSSGPKGRSLLVHLAEGECPGLWLDEAVELISAYGREQSCRLLFIAARWRWRRLAVRFWSPRWKVVGFTRDRPRLYRGRPCRHRVYMNRQDYYRVMQPVKKITMKHYESGRFCYFEERSS